MPDSDRPARCPVTGATGYPGGPLVPESSNPWRVATSSSQPVSPALSQADATSGVQIWSIV